MASSNRLVVEVVGDTSKLTSSLNSAQQQINRFAGKSKIRSTGADALLADVRGLSAQADALIKKEAEVTRQTDLVNSRFARLGGGSLIAGFAVNALGRNLQELGGNTAKFGNALSDLSSGNIVGFVKSLSELAGGADTANESLKKLLAAEGTTTVDLRAFAADTRETAAAQQELADAVPRSGNAVQGLSRTTANMGEVAAKTAADLRGTATAAEQLARAFDTSAQAAADVGAAIAAAGSEAAAFGERTRGPGGATAGASRGGGGFVDSTATSGTSNSIAESLALRTKGLQDDLAVAKSEAAQAKRLEDNQRSVVEGAAARHAETVAAFTKVSQIQNQIDAEAAAAAKSAQADRKRRAAEAKQLAEQSKRERESAARLAHQELLADIEFQQSLLELGVRRAQLTEKTTKDDIAAEKKLIQFFKQQSQNKKLTKAERRRFFLEAKNEQIDLAKLSKDAGSGPLTKTTSLNTNRILEGLGLSPAEERAVRARLSAFNSGGQALAAAPGSIGAFGQPIILQPPPVYLDGQKISTNTRNHNTVHAKSNPKQKRGSR